MGTSPLLNPQRPVRCPSCGSEKVHLRAKRDRIDRVTQTPSDLVKRLFTADMQLYHCYVCRLQFYDARAAAEPPAQEAPEAPAEPDPTTQPESAGITSIGPTVTIRGRLSSHENIVVNGEIEGDIEMPEHRLTIGMTGRLHGDAQVSEAEALGSIEGTVYARQKFTIRRSATITGDIRTPRLSIEDGAVVNGAIETA